MPKSTLIETVFVNPLVTVESDATCHVRTESDAMWHFPTEVDVTCLLFAELDVISTLKIHWIYETLCIVLGLIFLTFITEKRKPLSTQPLYRLFFIIYVVATTVGF